MISNPIPDFLWFRIALLLLPVIAAFFGVVLTNANNRKIQDARITSEREDRDMAAKRSAADQIFTLMESWAADMRISGVKLAGAIARVEPVPDADHRIIMDTSRYLRAGMLIQVHFSQLDPNWKAMLVEQQKVLGAAIPEEGDNRTPGERKQAVLDAVIALTRKNTSLLDSVTAALQSLHS